MGERGNATERGIGRGVAGEMRKKKRVEARSRKKRNRKKNDKTGMDKPETEIEPDGQKSAESEKTRCSEQRQIERQREVQRAKGTRCAHLACPKCVVAERAEDHHDALDRHNHTVSLQHKRKGKHGREELGKREDRKILERKK